MPHITQAHSAIKSNTDKPMIMTATAMLFLLLIWLNQIQHFPITEIKWLKCSILPEASIYIAITTKSSLPIPFPPTDRNTDSLMMIKEMLQNPKSLHASLQPK